MPESKDIIQYRKDKKKTASFGHWVGELAHQVILPGQCHIEWGHVATVATVFSRDRALVVSVEHRHRVKLTIPSVLQVHLGPMQLQPLRETHACKLMRIFKKGAHISICSLSLKLTELSEGETIFQRHCSLFLYFPFASVGAEMVPSASRRRIGCVPEHGSFTCANGWTLTSFSTVKKRSLKQALYLQKQKEVHVHLDRRLFGMRLWSPGASRWHRTGSTRSARCWRTPPTWGSSGRSSARRCPWRCRPPPPPRRRRSYAQPPHPGPRTEARSSGNKHWPL